MSKPIIAVDIDEVLSLLHVPFFTYHNETYGTDILTPNEKYYIDQHTGDTHETFLVKVRQFMTTDTYKNLQPLPGAVETLRHLQKDYELVILSSRQGIYFASTHEWLNRHFPRTFKEVHFTEHMVGKGSKISKADYCQKIGASYIIDDNVQAAEECARVGIKALLFGNYPWNKSDKLPAEVTRVKDWQAVREYFDARG